MMKKNIKKMAELADKHDLYEQSVQCVEAEIDFLQETFLAIRGYRAYRLREDFCGTTNTSCEWVKRDHKNFAYCVDVDSKVLNWAKKNKYKQLTKPQVNRICLINENVLTANTPQMDIVIAMNFSYWLFKTRDTMLQYYRHIYDNLKSDGIFFLDAYGGYNAYKEMKEKTKHEAFTYIWEQKKYNPITGEQHCRIHFKFKDGSKLANAFRYTWRLWSLPEILEILTETGFKATVYWEGVDEDGEGDGVFLPTNEGTADAGWIAYIVAEK